MTSEYETKLRDIITQQDWLMSALKNVRDLRLPDWYIGAGVIRNTVWNYLHNYPTTLYQKDIDVAYFDSLDMAGERERISEETLSENSSNLKWEVVNQARAHLFKHGQISRPPVKSSCESIAYWSETSNSIGVRLEDDNRLTICAPHGLDDLMNLIVRSVPKPYQNLSLYRERIAEKDWVKSWPRLKILSE